MALRLQFLSLALQLVLGSTLILMGVHLARQRRRNRRAAEAAMQPAAPGRALAAALAARRPDPPRVVAETLRRAAALPTRPWVELDLPRRRPGRGIMAIIPGDQWRVRAHVIGDPEVEAALSDLRCLLRACRDDHVGRGGKRGFLVQTGALSRFTFSAVDLVEIDRRWVQEMRLPVVQLPWDPAAAADGGTADQQSAAAFRLVVDRCGAIPWLERRTGFGRMVGFRLAGWNRGLLVGQGELLECDHDRGSRTPSVNALGGEFAWACADLGVGWLAYLSPKLVGRVAREALRAPLQSDSASENVSTTWKGFEVIARSGVSAMEGDAAATGLSREHFPPAPWARDVLVLDARAGGRHVGRMVVVPRHGGWKVAVVRTDPRHWTAPIVVGELADELAFRVGRDPCTVEVPRALARIPVWTAWGFRPSSRWSVRGGPTVELRRS